MAVLGVPGTQGVLGSRAQPAAPRRRLSLAPQPVEPPPNLRPDQVEEEPDFTGPVGRYQRHSTRMPEGEGAQDWRKGDLVTNTEEMKKDKKFFTKVINQIKEYPNLTEKEKEGPEEKVAENFKEHQKSNFHFLNELLEPEVRHRSRHWYPGGHGIISERANHFQIPMNSATGAYSAQSPQKDWHINASLGDRALHTVFRRGRETLSPQMMDKAVSIWGPKEDEEPPKSEASARIRERLAAENQALLEHLDRTRGQKLNDHLVDLYDKLKSGNFSNKDLERVGAWVRLFDEANHDPRYAIISPEGDYLDFASTQEGEHGRRSWGSALEAGSGVASAILKGDHDVIRLMLGDRHKVPSFGNNLGDPWHPAGDVTGDTHAAAGGLLMPLPAQHRYVSHMFSGPPKSKLHGLSGWYGILNDAISEASAEHGWRPSEGQGVFWGGARGIFPKWAKTKENIEAIHDMWKARGNKPIRNVQEQIYDFLRNQANERAARLKRPQAAWKAGGIGLPEWYGLHQRPGLKWDFFTKG